MDGSQTPQRSMVYNNAFAWQSLSLSTGPSFPFRFLMSDACARVISPSRLVIYPQGSVLSRVLTVPLPAMVLPFSPV